MLEFQNETVYTTSTTSTPVPSNLPVHFTFDVSGISFSDKEGGNVSTCSIMMNVNFIFQNTIP
jgi:hypothetical protein